MRAAEEPAFNQGTRVAASPMGRFGVQRNLMQRQRPIGHGGSLGTEDGQSDAQGPGMCRAVRAVGVAFWGYKHPSVSVHIVAEQSKRTRSTLDKTGIRNLSDYRKQMSALVSV